MIRRSDETDYVRAQQEQRRGQAPREVAEREKKRMAAAHRREHEQEPLDRVDIASMESFPASDPPGY